MTEDEVEDLRRHPLVDPLDDRKIILDPARIRVLWSNGDVDVLQEIATPKMNLEQMAPMIVVVLWKIWDNRDERGNVGDCIDIGDCLG